MTIGPDMFTNIVNIDRVSVFRQSKDFANQQNTWGPIKRNIYIAMMSSLAGTGYNSGLDLCLDGAYKYFLDVHSAIMPNKTAFIHGGMNYEEAHKLITEAEPFQSINC